ncbi:hypothetical protein FW800_25715 [Pseudomonas sp. 910_23]|uniref:hypothetical protein n=1 Tax=Pseudomonas sp. 910_23 TaxID=2604461 RepID=UPI0040646154
MPEPIQMEVLAASRGRFLETPKVSEAAWAALHKLIHFPTSNHFGRLMKKGHSQAGVFQGLSITIRFKVERFELLTLLPRLLPGHLQQITPDGLVTLSGPVLSLLNAWSDFKYLAFSQEWEELLKYIHAFNKTIAEEFPEDSLLALQALIDRKEALHVATQQDPQGIHTSTRQAGETPGQA